MKLSEDDLVAVARRRWADILEGVDVTPCPPATEWCDQNGGHGWKRGGAGFERSHRFHWHEVTDDVAVLMDEYDPSHSEEAPDIEVRANEVFLRSAADVEAHIAALREASRIAFGPGDR